MSEAASTKNKIFYSLKEIVTRPLDRGILLTLGVQSDMITEDEALGMLAEGDIDVNAQGADDGSTPLKAASFWHMTRLVDALLQAGANPDCRDKMGNTPLMWVSMSEGPKAEEIMRSLLRAGAKLDLQQERPDPECRYDDHGNTALINAVAMRRAGLVRILLDAGADIDTVRNKEGRTALDAVREGCADPRAGGSFMPIRQMLETALDCRRLNAATQKAQAARKSRGPGGL